MSPVAVSIAPRFDEAADDAGSFVQGAAVKVVVVVSAIVLVSSCAEPAEVIDVVQCGDGTVLEDDRCVVAVVDADAPLLTRVAATARLPFLPDTEVEISQGARGVFSHTEIQQHAVDFVVDEGTTVVAMRAGIVTWLREDSDRGCGDPSCASDGNYLYIDHGDGTSDVYFHLQQDGALVDLYDVVGAGQPIGLSGNTGFSTGPHLHVEVDDLFFDSVPLLFEECDGPCVGSFPYTSRNIETAPPPTQSASDCPFDLFAHAGVLLDDGVPCTIAEATRPYQLAGTVIAPDAEAVNFGYFMGGEFQQECIGLDDDNRFSFELRLPAGLIDATETTVYFTASVDVDCTIYPGTETVSLRVVAPIAASD